MLLTYCYSPSILFDSRSGNRIFEQLQHTALLNSNLKFASVGQTSSPSPSKYLHYQPLFGRPLMHGRYIKGSSASVRIGSNRGTAAILKLLGFQILIAVSRGRSEICNLWLSLARCYLAALKSDETTHLRAAEI